MRNLEQTYPLGSLKGVRQELIRLANAAWGSVTAGQYDVPVPYVQPCVGAKAVMSAGDYALFERMVERAH